MVKGRVNISIAMKQQVMYGVLMAYLHLTLDHSKGMVKGYVKEHGQRAWSKGMVKGHGQSHAYFNNQYFRNDYRGRTKVLGGPKPMATRG